MTWEQREPDHNGEACLVGVTMGRTYLITESPAHGVRLWRLDGMRRAMQGRFATVEDAKEEAAA